MKSSSSNTFPELYKSFDITSVRCPPPENINYGVNIKRKFNCEGNPSFDAAFESALRIFSTDTPTAYELETVKKHLSKRIEELRPLSFFKESDKEFIQRESIRELLKEKEIPFSTWEDAYRKFTQMENSPTKRPGGEEKFYENYKKRYNHRVGSIRRLYEEKFSNVEYYEMVLEESGYYPELERVT